MFELDYRIVHSEYDNFVGEHGFLQIKCNGYCYGEMYPKELEVVMDKVSLYDWFNRLTQVIKYLKTKEYVALSDTESYNTWIEFRREGEDVFISIIRAEKSQGSHDIEFTLKKVEHDEWMNQVTSFNQLKKEIFEKEEEYIRTITVKNIQNTLFDRKKKELEEIRKSLYDNF